MIAFLNEKGKPTASTGLGDKNQDLGFGHIV